MKYFKGSVLATSIGLLAAAWIGYGQQGTITSLLDVLFVVIVLAVLEVSLSFDNAIVNARVLKNMDALWRRRFLTWGMLIAVFGMRVLFPLLIVAVIGALSPGEALRLALYDSPAYERIMLTAEPYIIGFGASFLFLVGISYFFDAQKEVHWIHRLEMYLQKIGRLYLAEVMLVLGAGTLVAYHLPAPIQFPFLVACISGIITFTLVRWIETLTEHVGKDMTKSVASAGLASFLYLEVVDASFSFDGVIGAFALSNNILIIAIGLGIGAFFVRSFTIMLVERNTLDTYKYLEHGAFWALLALATMMYAGLFIHIPEVIVGSVGLAFLAASFVSSRR
ncbi:hypothetical protein A3C89_00800 [Candidatus Kaiserbacteria bacterium RIFCSPHIGHO2_02_FULL_50_50]|uniref:DUF475 domain-containing protein n=1 Tax=Candidatus Kaiserbacteria bacterium RIFCSPHIGHO2_02_FULL_50_50 TaxID=1798492 RepID=A0A1F6DFT0_9BACT|nr:MAG: hypothetical protein A3C89_00800 [Candidatus Kaiserbacteria bacterium RIFCSPHIGHO2_02_FULL_50_50]OGG88885.1 MAG: hypothetical protein A3G62_03240 [Candidatus Kaiserbacteria bacterium RIFCSPLOWO2_12_FULL_50_10]